MKNIIAKTAAILASASILGATLMPVLADSATNDTTGAESTNNTAVNNSNVVSITNVSDARIENTVVSTSNTGGNRASKNTMGGAIQTGDATTNVQILNNANINTNLVDMSRGAGSANTAGNSITGAESTNNASIANANSVSVMNNNTALVRNTVSATSNTGDNRANKNTDGLGGVVQTGDAETLVSLQNRVNDNATSVGGLANWGSNIVGNSITGYKSTNNAAIANSNLVQVDNISDAFVSNTVVANANTGRNRASRNTMGGMVQTGDAGIGIELLTDANINTTGVDATMAGAGGTSGNSVTGAESTNNTALNNRNVFKVANWNNKGKSEDAKDPQYAGILWGVVNNDVDNANTGDNRANANTYPASVATGIAEVGKYIRVCLNDSLTTIGALLP